MIKIKVAIDIEDALEEVEIPAKTYKIDFDNKRIIGKTDGMEAVKQFIKKALLTTRGKYQILYSDDYGSDIENALLGESVTQDYIYTVVPALIKEALLIDDRISDVYSIEVKNEDDKLFISFMVSCDFGELEIKEVI